MSHDAISEFGPDYVRAIAPYQAGKPIAEVAREFGLEEANIVKLASNENPFGVPESSRRPWRPPWPSWPLSGRQAST